MRKIRWLKLFSEGFNIGARFMFYMMTLLAVGYMYGLEFIPELDIPAPYPFEGAAGMALIICAFCYLLAFLSGRAARHFEKQLHPVLEFPDNNVTS